VQAHFLDFAIMSLTVALSVRLICKVKINFDMYIICRLISIDMFDENWSEILRIKKCLLVDK